MKRIISILLSAIILLTTGTAYATETKRSDISYNTLPVEFSDNLGTTESFGFRHFDIGLSKPLADTGVTASMNYTVGGYDRADEKQKNKVVFGLKYEF